MTTRSGWRRWMVQGALFGLVAGLLFAFVEIAGAVAMGDPASMPLRMFASVVLGEEAVGADPPANVIAVGVLAHAGLSALFGLIYGVANGAQPALVRRSFSHQAPLGLLFGVALWFVNFQIIARLIYPWFLGTPQLLQAMMHALFYGLPLSLLFTASERRRIRVGHAPRPA